MKTLAKKMLTGLGYQVTRTRYVPRQLLEPRNILALDFDHVVCRRMIEKGPAFNFIQVGGFDGVTADPLRKYIERHGWRGVLLEPQSKWAAALRALYPDDGRIAIIQGAVDATLGERTLYTIISDDAPAWAAGLASFEREVILKHADLLPNLEASLHEEVVACVTFNDVLAKLGSEEIDLLQVDTEGADAYILSLFPFELVRPAIVHWEVKHLPLTEQDACLRRLVAHGYQVASSGGEDMMAVLRQSQ